MNVIPLLRRRRMHVIQLLRRRTNVIKFLSRRMIYPHDQVAEENA
jgi:hypothetical protein